MSMLASLLRPKGPHGHLENSPLSPPYATRETSPWFRAATRPGITRRYRRIGPRDVPEQDTWIEEEEEPEEEEGEEDGPLESTPLLPIFSASHLGRTACRSLSTS
jgi:hypothetical protein